MKTIYNVYVPIENQEQADRMKQICIDYGLPIWDDEDAFTYITGKNIFRFQKKANEFWITSTVADNLTQVTESEFLELVKINFAN